VGGQDLQLDSHWLIRELAQQAGLAIHDDEVAAVAEQYHELLQMVDTIESVQLEVEEESALGLDLFAWEATPEGPVVAHEGDAP
jgi:hypothetical protein